MGHCGGIVADRPRFSGVSVAGGGAVVGAWLAREYAFRPVTPDSPMSALGTYGRA